MNTQQTQREFKALSEPATRFFDSLYNGELTTAGASEHVAAREAAIKKMGAAWVDVVLSKCHVLILQSMGF